MPKLTKRSVEGLEPRNTDYLVFDSELPGFGVRVMPSGRKSYLVQYRSGGRTRRLALGWHGALTAEEARKEAMSRLGEVAKGGTHPRKSAASGALRRSQHSATGFRPNICPNTASPEPPSTISG